MGQSLDMRGILFANVLYCNRKIIVIYDRQQLTGRECINQQFYYNCSPFWWENRHWGMTKTTRTTTIIEQQQQQLLNCIIPANPNNTI